MNLKNKLINDFYNNGKNANEKDVKLYYYWNAFLNIVEENKDENIGLRAGIRAFIENNIEDMDGNVDFEDSVLDVLYERPVFEDLRVEEERDLYYYEDFNTNRQMKANDDYLLSIKTFQRVLEDSDLISMYMSVFKIYNYVLNKENDKYSERETRLIDASNYLLECALNNLIS